MSVLRSVCGTEDFRNLRLLCETDQQSAVFYEYSSFNGLFFVCRQCGGGENNGFEIGLNGIILRNPAHHFSWSGRAQLVYNKNRIVKVSEAIKAQNEEYLKQM